MNTIGFEKIHEISGIKVGVMVTPTQKPEVLAGLGIVKNGEAFIDCLPFLKGKYVLPIPDTATIAKAQEPSAPYTYIVMVGADTELGAFVADALAKGRVSRN